ncbi:hypothetical protein J2X68_007770 [Streptomyces sp. 3330]|uniref:hypothetical protein n=1 Tax=Streptomyces sp. 3330 TaxID=2817755 RepID=UPI002866F7B4|nr:hypothetical protein [Streptomyces sp. 3330]MDR6981028.1 hypothetical protein [Streptomyces sp. 3330]
MERRQDRYSYRPSAAKQEPTETVGRPWQESPGFSPGSGSRTWCRLQDEASCLLLADLVDDTAGPLTALSAFTDVMAELKGDRLAEPLTMEQLPPIGSYRFF